MTLFQSRQPVVTLRGLHLDLKGLQPTYPRLLEIVKLCKALRFNAIVVEWEDTFPWSFDPRLRNQTAYTPEEIRGFAKACVERQIEIIPLVQSVGHAENVLNKPGYESMREVSTRTDVFHPLHPGSSEIVIRQVEDILHLLPETRRFHIGGDEAYTLGQHEQSRAYIARHGAAQLYLRQVLPIIEALEARGVRPLLWHDELVSWDPDEFKQLACRADIVVWGYTGNPQDPSTYHYRLPHAEKLSAAGYTLWAATSYKGADGPSANCPDALARQVATLGWVELQPRFQWQGIIATGWSRYASGRIQVSPMEAAFDSLVLSAIILHDGKLPDAPLSLARQWLDHYGEGNVFRTCRDVMERLTTHTDKAWSLVRQLEEQLAHIELESFRASSGIEEIILKLLDAELSELRKIGHEVEHCLAGKICAPLPALYHLSRLRPLETATKRLQNAITSASAAP